MSASKEKRERKALYESGALDKNPNQTQKLKKRKKMAKTLVILAAVLVVLGSCGWLYFSGFLANHTTAVTAGEHKLSPTMFNYYYRDAYFEFYETNKSYIDMILDPKLSLSKQLYSKETKQTWADYFIEEGKKNAAQTYALYDASVREGFSLSAEDEQSLTNLREDLAIYAQMNGAKSAEAYIRTTYGAGCSLDGYLAYSRIRRTAASYAADHKAAYTYSPENLREAYAAAPNDFDKVSYKVFYVSKPIGKDESGAVIADMPAAEEMAKGMVSLCVGDIDKFDELSVELAEEKKKDLYRDPNFTLRKNYAISESTEALQPWLADPSRKYGDTTYVQADERAYYVGFFIDRSDNAYQLPTLHYAKITAADAEAESMKKADKLAGEVLAKYDAGAQTASAFDEAVKAVSADNSAVAAAVTQENFTPGTLKDVADDWCFSPDRRAGDAAMLSAPDGYYVLYFDKFGPVYRDYLVDTKLREADYTAWYEESAAIYTPESSAFGLLFMHK